CGAVVVALNAGVVLLAIVARLSWCRAANSGPVVPPSQSPPEVEGPDAPLMQVLFGVTPVAFGWLGVFSALAIVFFAYIGFDIVAAAAEEARRPQRDLPIRLVGSLVVTAVLYASVATVLAGMQRYTELSTEAPLADAFTAVGRPVFATIIDVGVVVGLVTVVLILLLGMSRIFFALSRDGLMPAWISAVHPRFGTPYRSTVIMGVIVA